MHVKMIVTYCNGEITPKEAHIDAFGISTENTKNVLDACIKDLRNNIAKIEKILTLKVTYNKIKIEKTVFSNSKEDLSLEGSHDLF